MRYNKIGVIALLLFGMVIGLAGIVCADQVVNATPEIQSLSTVTTADVDGLAMETDAGAWSLTYDPPTVTPGIDLDTYSGVTGVSDPVFLAQVSAALQSQGGSIDYEPYYSLWVVYQVAIPSTMLNQALPPSTIFPSGTTYQDFGHSVSGGANPTITQLTPSLVKENGLHTGALDPGQVQYTTAYDANIVAQAGHTSFVKSMNVHTGNKVIGQSNLDAKTALTYIATADGGNVVGSENLMLDGAGMPTTAADKMLCPFASAGGNVIPAYCNIIQVGSKYDLTIGSVTTSANDKFVGSDATIPVVLNYAINVKPYTASGTQVPAIGSAMAYIKAHIQEGNNFNTTKAEDLTYSETSSVNGYINSFSKVIAYQSGKSLL